MIHNFTKNPQIGFSLVELMIVIAIIGVLSSIAIPTYRDHTIRAKVMELIAIAQPAKLAVTETLLSGVPKAQIDNAKVGLEVIQNRGKIKELSIAGSIITIIGESQKLDIDESKTLKIVFKPDIDEMGIIIWSCGVEPNEFKKYVPESCRNAMSTIIGSAAAASAH